MFTRYKLCGSLLVPAMISSTAGTRARGVAPSVGDSRARRLGFFRAGLRGGEAESGGLFGAGRILSLLGDVRRALHGSHVLVGGVLGGLGSRLLGRGRGFVDDVFVGQQQGRRCRCAGPRRYYGVIYYGVLHAIV